MVGRALRPVEAIRREVDAISSTALHRRVSEPPGADEIARLSATMNRMLDRLDRAQQQQRRFVSDASHELRSPIAAIRQYAEVALMHPARTSVPELARSVLDEDLRVQHLVEDLLPLARADEHRLRLRTTAVDLDDLARPPLWCSTRRATSAAPRDGRSTSRRCAAAARGDAAALRRVLRNLGENAARHARSRVAFSLDEIDTGVELVVDDDGPGIPPPSGTGSCSGSCGSTRRAAAATAEQGWAWRSSRSWSPRTAAGWPIADSPAGGARLRLTFP